MKDEEINIETLSDIVDKVPLESLDCFMTDLKAWVNMAKTAKDVNNLFDFYVLSVPKSIRWIDDGRNDVEINVEISIEDK
jgi:hypothetical protein